AIVAGLALAAVHPALGAALLPVLRSSFGAVLAAGFGALAPAIGARLVTAGARATRAGIVAGAAIDIAPGCALATGLLAAARGAGGCLSIEILRVGIDVEISLEQLGGLVVLVGAEPGIATRFLAARMHARGGPIPALLRLPRVPRRLVRFLGVLVERHVF